MISRGQCLVIAFRWLDWSVVLAPSVSRVCAVSNRVLVQVLLAEAEELKSRGNDLFKQEQHVEAIEEYDKALDVAPPDAIQRAIYHANKAACHLALEGYKECIDCCSAALTVNPDYLKALRRRMTAHEKLDELENALADAKRVRLPALCLSSKEPLRQVSTLIKLHVLTYVVQIVELDPGDSKTAQSIAKWTPLVAERQEKMKEEVMGKLKDLGNSVLGNFGMSLDNFKMDKDPNTGGYSIRFEQ